MDWKIVYDHYQFAYSLTKNSNDAKDLLQEFALKSLQAGVKEMNPSYVQTGLRFLFLDRKRYIERMRHLNVNEDFERLEVAYENESLEKETDTVDLLDEIQKANLPISKIKKGLTVHNAKLGDFLLMHYFLGMKCRDISSATGLSINTIIGKLKYGRDRLKKSMQN